MSGLRAHCLTLSLAACLFLTGCKADAAVPLSIRPSHQASRCGLDQPKTLSDWTNAVTIGHWLFRYPSDWVVFGSGVKYLYPQADFKVRLEVISGSLVDLDFAGFRWAMVNGELVAERCSSGIYPLEVVRFGPRGEHVILRCTVFSTACRDILMSALPLGGAP